MAGTSSIVDWTANHLIVGSLSVQWNSTAAVPTTYTTVAATTARTFVSTANFSTANLSTFTGVSGVGAAFVTRAAAEAHFSDMAALARVVQTMYQDLKDQGILR